jgi:hypothetical protein
MGTYFDNHWPSAYEAGDSVGYKSEAPPQLRITRVVFPGGERTSGFLYSTFPSTIPTQSSIYTH